ncbi:MAG: hypothetical protein HY432_00010 [Candidatus Liptonbacteria bacterium]|nr:hypothetical protein [Candidatus Liptonbacteria bacterium]
MENNALESRMEALEKRVEALENGLTETIRTSTIIDPENRLNFNEFLNKQKLDDDVKRTLALAYWLEYFEKVNSINIADIEKYFRLARFPIPKNINDKINMNVKNKHLAPIREKKDGKKAWYITNKGAAFIESNLNK